MRESIALNGYWSGAGLFELGWRMAGIEPQQSFEIDPACCRTLRHNFKHEVVECDITRKLVSEEKPCQVMVMTYPCTKYSPIGDIHGVRTGDEMFLHSLRHLAIGRPEVYWIENVRGIKKFPVVMEAMMKLPDYYVQVFCPVASSLWLPQRRDRLIIIGSRRRFDWRAPASGHRVSLIDILEEEPQVKIPDYVYKRLDGAYRDKPIICDPARGDIAPTCVAHYAKDCSTRLVVDKRFPRGVRPFTVREYTRLQGVPDWFEFPVSDNEAFRMIGNGVSIPVGQWAAEETKRYFA